MELYISGHNICTHLYIQQGWEITEHAWRVKGKSKRDGETEDVEERYEQQERSPRDSKKRWNPTHKKRNETVREGL